MSSPAAPNVHRKASVVIIEDQSAKSSNDTLDGNNLTSAGGGVKIDPKAIAAQLLSSIPQKEKDIVKGWMCKQVVITRLDQGQGPAPSITGVNIGPSAQAAGASTVAPMNRLKKQGTSKMHRFQPAVTLEQSIAWLSEYGNADSSVLFTNDCCIMFERGAFLEFEDIRDEEDE